MGRLSVMPVCCTRLGPEIYDLLGLQRPDPQLNDIQAHWGILTEEERQQMSNIVQDAVEGKNAKK